MLLNLANFSVRSLFIAFKLSRYSIYVPFLAWIAANSLNSSIICCFILANSAIPVLISLSLAWISLFYVPIFISLTSFLIVIKRPKLPSTYPKINANFSRFFTDPIPDCTTLLISSLFFDFIKDRLMRIKNKIGIILKPKVKKRANHYH